MANIIVVFPKAEDAQNICRVLRHHGYSVRGCTSSSTVLQLVDELGEGVVVCGYRMRGMLYNELYDMLPPSFGMLLVASARLMDADPPDRMEVLEPPLRTAQLTTKIDEMSDRMTVERKKRHGRAARSALQQEKIDRAKQLLMERHQWTESEAHRYLQKTSMDSGRNLAETAAMIVSLMTPAG